MPDARNDNPNPERSPDAERPESRPLEISPEALELLRSAAIPSEFLEIMREVEPRMEPPRPVRPERFPTAAGIEEPSLERPMPEWAVAPDLEMPMEPWTEEPAEPGLEMPTEPAWEEPAWTEPELPLEPPDDVRPEGGAGLNYLTDITLEVSGVGHVTPGLLDLAGSTLAPLIRGTFFWQGSAGISCLACLLVL